MGCTQGKPKGTAKRTGQPPKTVQPTVPPGSVVPKYNDPNPPAAPVPITNSSGGQQQPIGMWTSADNESLGRTGEMNGRNPLHSTTGGVIGAIPQTSQINYSHISPAGTVSDRPALDGGESNPIKIASIVGPIESQIKPQIPAAPALEISGNQASQGSRIEMKIPAPAIPPFGSSFIKPIPEGGSGLGSNSLPPLPPPAPRVIIEDIVIEDPGLGKPIGAVISGINASQGIVYSNQIGDLSWAKDVSNEEYNQHQVELIHIPKISVQIA